MTTTTQDLQALRRIIANYRSVQRQWNEWNHGLRASRPYDAPSLETARIFESRIIRNNPELAGFAATLIRLA